MNLVLWRHAEAESNTPDHARALTDRGHLQAKRMAAWLNARLPLDTRVLASPAVRAQQTVAALQRAFTTSAVLDTTTDSATDSASVLRALGLRDTGGTMLLVGHQPTLGYLAALLLTGTESNLAINPAAVWWLELNGGHGVHAQLRAVMTPDML